jgi:hypothetical protein
MLTILLPELLLVVCIVVVVVVVVVVNIASSVSLANSIFVIDVDDMTTNYFYVL